MNRGFTYQHWAGVSNRTHPYGLAITYVFIKQSEPPGHCDQLLRRAGTPSTEDTGPFCRIPSTAFLRRALGFSPRDTCVSSRYGLSGSFLFPFSRAPSYKPKPLYRGLFTLSPGSHHYGTPHVYTLKQGDSPARLSPKRLEKGSRCRMYLRGTGILTCFPFEHVKLCMSLGPTNPQPTIVAEEASPLRRWGFSPHFAATTGGILIPARSTGTYAPASTLAGRLPTR